jgi:diguanylate cyclase
MRANTTTNTEAKASTRANIKANIKANSRMPFVTKQVDPDMPNPLAGKGRRFVQRVYKLRTIGLGAGFFCVASVLWGMHTSRAVWLLLVLHGFIWPHLACRSALRNPYPYRRERLNLMLDALLGGFWVVAMQFNVLPSTLILTMLSMNDVAAGGARLFWRGLAAHVLGAAIGIVLLGWSFAPQSQMQTILICLPFLVFYPLALGNTTYKMAQQLAQRSKELEQLSRIDGLTNLLNRRYWETRLAEAFHHCQHDARHACLALLDLDHFKTVNDTRGHVAGDGALQSFSRMLESLLRKTDIIGRYGGEEFGVILIDTTLAEATQIVTRLVEAIRDQANQAGSQCPCTTSVGISAYTPALSSYHDWLLEVDRAMYRAKDQGRDRIVIAGAAPD